MSDFLNPLGGRFVGPTGLSGPNVISATIPDPPRTIARLDPGTILKGIVIGREADGLTAIATDKGTVKLATNIALPVGAHVTIEVRPAGDRLQALILSVEGGQRLHPPTAASTSAASRPAGAGPAPTGPLQSGEAGTNRTPPASSTDPAHAPAPRSAEPADIRIVGSSLRATVVHPFIDPPETIQPPSTLGGTTANQAGRAPTFSETASTALAGTIAAATPAPPTGPKDESPGLAAPRSPQGQTPAILADAQARLLAVIAAIDNRPEASSQAAALPPSGASDAKSTGIAAAFSSPLGTKSVAAPPAPPPSVQSVPSQPTEAIASNIPLNSALSSNANELSTRIATLFAASIAAETPTISSQPTGSIFRNKPAGNSVLQGQAAPTQETAPLPLGAELKLHVLAVQASSDHPIEFAPQSGASLKIVVGRVIALTPAGHPVIRTPVGEIMLEEKSTLPVGAQIALSIDAIEAAPPAQAAAVPSPVQSPQQALLSLSRGWPTLADLLFIVMKGSASAPDDQVFAQREAIRHAFGSIPQVGPRLATGIMNTLVALRAGDVDRLLGALFRLKGGGQEREEAIRRLRTEFQQLSALAQDRPDVDWRALFLPVLDERGRLTQINLFYRRSRREEAGDERTGAGTRFVVEADFSRLGPFQLDGLVRKKRFELMVRSHHRLTERMRRDIEAIYEEARGISGFAGSIAFQTVAEFPVAPLEEIRAAGPRTSI